MTTATKAVPERVAELDALHLDNGGHHSFEAGHCAMELVSYLADEPHSAHPKCSSRVLTSFLIRLNDGLPDDARQKLKPYLPKVIGTADDGQDEARGWLAADWTVRVALPTWLELNGTKEAATMLRELAPITDAEGMQAIRPRLIEIREAAWDRRQDAMGKLRAEVRTKVEEKLKKDGKFSSAVAVAAAEAAAVAAAAAVAEAAAAAAAAAVAAAVAVAAAAAVAAAEAVAVAAAAAAAAAEAAAAAAAAAVAAAVAAADPYSSRWYEMRKAVREAVRKAIEPVMEEKIRPTSESLLESALLTLDRMIDPKAGE